MADLVHSSVLTALITNFGMLGLSYEIKTLYGGVVLAWCNTFVTLSKRFHNISFLVTRDRGSTRSASARRRKGDRFESRADTAS